MSTASRIWRLCVGVIVVFYLLPTTLLPPGVVPLLTHSCLMETVLLVLQTGTGRSCRDV